MRYYSDIKTDFQMRYYSDIKTDFQSCNPLVPTYSEAKPSSLFLCELMIRIPPFGNPCFNIFSLQNYRNVAFL